MAYLISILGSLTLLFGFLALTWYEERRGQRLFAERRARFDRQVTRVEYILAHVDLWAFMREEVRRVVGRIGHDIAHISLQVVRAVERLLTRLVRYFRTRHEIDMTPRESARPFVKTLSDFKDRLKATHPDISDVE
ncbi:hypothetical protein KGQ72_03060 [Patescibacteria group bacterium]|nr:hypothetical protein [Patescibacteria group bacterium]